MVTNTREALLVAARAEFAAHGIAGARVDRIAKAAGVNKERIYGYFGSKEKLFDLVVEEALEKLTESMPLLEDDPAEIVGSYYDYYRDNPEVLRLLMWEALNYREGDLPGTETRRVRCANKIGLLAKGLGVEPSREVGMTMVNLISLVLMPMAMPQLRKLIVGDDSDDGLREHLVDFARRALKNPASSAATDTTG
ncbi:MAG: TetR/AcrR family transcriptional regulator [Stackebrandtia sp.]